ncbi:zinc dependent phospholipase C family protein [Paenibacillus flagellatus]|uniref:Phospholipase C/D domain-containing protein n=1 Tax=Paenibacillus flagellatus TaxID=2211139 RepID=A0A2V5L010_9BACL|nr:zinc dependent phospholipase C family protein [Paenibacillus flagellatus]PYI55856.1 hypothetical protein DLM86_09075 [Paenibacillus flagellatus]
MPNIWTHFLFGRELADRVGWSGPSTSSAVERAYHFGCQGPDFLFYHRFLPWQKSAGMPELGGAMHSRRCGPFLLDLLDAVKDRPLDSPDAAFALGFLTHHILDRNAHPYVFYRSGFKKWDHQRFEIMIDTLIVRSRLGLETWRTPVWKRIDAGPALPGEMADVLAALARSHYPELAGHLGPDDWNEAYRDMIRAQKLFHDPSGAKRLLTFGRIEALVYKRTVPPVDVLNEARREWRHPSIEDETHTESFMDLWEMAMEDGVPLLRSALDYVAGNGSRSRLEARLGDVSYETGKPCADGHTILYADPII